MLVLQLFVLETPSRASSPLVLLFLLLERGCWLKLVLGSEEQETIRCPVMNCEASASQWTSISLMEGKRAGESRNGRTRIKGGFALPCLSQEGLWLCLEPFQPASLRSRSPSLEWAVNWQAGQASWLLRPRGSLWCPLWAAELSLGKCFSSSPFCSFSSLPRD